MYWQAYDTWARRQYFYPTYHYWYWAVYYPTQQFQFDQAA